MRPWDLDRGENLEFYPIGEKRSGGFQYRRESYFKYGDIIVVDEEGNKCRTLASDVYEGFYQQIQTMIQHLIRSNHGYKPNSCCICDSTKPWRDS